MIEVKNSNRFLTVTTELHQPPTAEQTKGWELKNCYDTEIKRTVNGQQLPMAVTVWIFEKATGDRLLLLEED